MPSLFLPCEKPPAVSGPGWKTFVPAGALPTVETVQKVDALRTATGPIEIFWAPRGMEQHFLGLGGSESYIYIYLYNLYIIIYIIICKIMIYIKSCLAKSSKL